MREVVVDTETTGLDPAFGHRLVEIACVEILNFVPTGQTFHVYLNPQRDMPQEAFAIHGLSAEFLSSKPLFDSVVDDLIGFIGNSRMIIHNAEFDMKFINAELKAAARETIGMANVFDTLALARKKHPGASNSLDALCARYKINASKRVKHGALTDAELLAEVYAELMGGRQTTLTLAADKRVIELAPARFSGKRSEPLPASLSEAEKAAHAAFVGIFKVRALWLDYAED